MRLLGLHGLGKDYLKGVKEVYHLHYELWHGKLQGNEWMTWSGYVPTRQAKTQ